MTRHKLYYSEFAKMISDKRFLQSVKRAIDGVGTDLDSKFVVVDSGYGDCEEIIEIVKDE